MNLRLRRYVPGRPRPARARRPLVAALLAGVLAGVLAAPLAGCGSGGDSAQSPSPTGTPNTQQVAALYRQVAQCVRQHGVPNLPDPVQNPTTGEWELPPGTAEPPKAALEACRSLFDRIPQRNDHVRPKSAADIAKLRQFSRCMRDHGLPDWPDPDTEGAFPLPARLERLGKLGILTQLQACKQYNPDRGITIKRQVDGK